MLNGLDAVRQIKSIRPETKVVMLTMHLEVQLAVEAFRAGASGYVLKASPGEELITAIQEAAKGRSYLTPLIAKDLLSVLIEAKSSETTRTKLTQRQREVLQLIAEGRTMKEIASILRISSRTAESHKYEMMQVLGVSTTAELIQHAIRLNLVTVLGQT
jgi:DNA-binding NarL/FixJ family response regulator